MPRCLFIVTDTFLIRGRGIVLIPGIVPIGQERFHVGDPVRLKRPDGSDVRRVISGIELPYLNPSGGASILVKDLTKEDVPIGTEVWSVDDGAVNE
jgi:hypothetical protein